MGNRTGTALIEGYNFFTGDDVNSEYFIYEEISRNQEDWLRYETLVDLFGDQFNWSINALDGGSINFNDFNISGSPEFVQLENSLFGYIDINDSSGLNGEDRCKYRRDFL